MLAYYQHGEPSGYEGISESLFQLYRMRTAQCLLSGDISKCLPHTVETLRFNATAELNRKDDNRRGLWIMTGVVVRTAINMGYHLDPSNSPGISALQAEYRRRTWLSVISMDDMAAFLGGFPRMGSAIHSDTKEPRNLYDWELSGDAAIPPSPRPLTEATPATYLIVKGRLFRALGRVADANSAPGPVSYETILEIDRAVQHAYQSIPPHMKVAPLADDNSRPNQVSHYSNMGLLCMYHKGMCMLHRKFLAMGRVEGRFKVSRDRCIASALRLLDFQLSLQPLFYRISQTRQMLTLAAMILFLELELRRHNADIEASPDSSILLQALEKTCSLWAEAVGVCDDAQRVHGFLDGMLTSFNAGSGIASTGSSQATSPEAPVESSRLSIQFNPYAFNVPLEDKLSTVDFDWVSTPLPKLGVLLTNNLGHMGRLYRGGEPRIWAHILDVQWRQGIYMFRTCCCIGTPVYVSYSSFGFLVLQGRLEVVIIPQPSHHRSNSYVDAADSIPEVQWREERGPCSDLGPQFVEMTNFEVESGPRPGHVRCSKHLSPSLITAYSEQKSPKPRLRAHQSLDLLRLTPDHRITGRLLSCNVNE